MSIINVNANPGGAGVGSANHVRKTITFDGTAGGGAAVTVTVFTITGRVYVTRVTAFCTTLLSTTGAATISFGEAGDVDCFIASTTATDIDANEWWGTTVPAAGSYSPTKVTTGGYQTAQTDKWLAANPIFTIGTADISTGVIVVDMWYEPITDGAGLA